MHNSKTCLNILFGSLALQNNIVAEEAFADAFDIWVKDKSKRIDKIMLEKGTLDREGQQALVVLVKRCLKRHDNKPQLCVESIDVPTELVRSLEACTDADVRETTVIINATKGPADSMSTIACEGPDFTSQHDRYRIIRTHARGGLGRIYIAQDTEINREVALKEMLEHVAGNENAKSRFLVEAEVTGRLEHPGIVPVYGLGMRDNGCPYYAMRFVQGETLSAAVDLYHKSKSARDPGANLLELRSLLGRLIDVCNAIEYAHSRGIIHRDLKPSNIMLGKFGETLVVDWGLAKSVGRSDSQLEDGTLHEITLQPQSDTNSAATVYGQAMGTPAYMPPEQAAGRISEINQLSDVYGLGATLFCLLTGRPPFEDSDIPILERVEAGNFPRPKQLQSDVDRRLESICLKAMSRVPIDRYGSAKELANDLERWLADEPVQALPDRTVERVRRTLRRHRSWTMASTAALVMVTLVSVIALAVVNRSRGIEVEQKRIANQKAEEASRNEARAREAELEARREQVRSLIMNAWVHGLDGGFESALLTTFQAYKKSQSFPDLREENQRRLSASIRLYPLVRSWNDVVSAQASPDGNYAALAFADGRIQVIDFDTGDPAIEPIEAGQTILFMAFSHDGSRLAVSTEESAISTWDTENGTLLDRITVDEGVEQLWFSASKELLLFETYEQSVKQIDLNTKSIQALNPSIQGQLVDSNDRYLLFEDPKSFTVVEIESGKQLGTTVNKPVEEWASIAVISADGLRVAYATNSQVYPTPIPAEPVPEVPSAPATSYSQEDTYFVSLRSKRQDDDVEPDGPLPERRGQIVITEPWGYPNSTVLVFDTSSGQEIAALPEKTARVIDLDFSPSGERIAVVPTPSDSFNSFRHSSQFVSIWNIENHTSSAFPPLISGCHGVVYGPTDDMVLTIGQSPVGMASVELWLVGDQPENSWIRQSTDQSPGFLNAFLSPTLWHDFEILNLYTSKDGTRFLVSGAGPIGTGARLWDLEEFIGDATPLHRSDPNSPFEFLADDQFVYGLTEPRILDPRDPTKVSFADNDVRWIEQTVLEKRWIYRTEERMRTVGSGDGARVETYVVQVPLIQDVEFTRYRLSQSGTLDGSQPDPFDSTNAAVNEFLMVNQENTLIGHSVDWSAVLMQDSLDGSMRLWDMENPTDPKPLGPSLAQFNDVKLSLISPDKTSVVAISDQYITVWDVKSGLPLMPMRSITFQPHSLRLSPSGRFLAMSSDKGIHLLDLYPDFTDDVSELEEQLREATLHEIDTAGTVVPIAARRMRSLDSLPSPPAPDPYIDENPSRSNTGELAPAPAPIEEP